MLETIVTIMRGCAHRRRLRRLVGEPVCCTFGNGLGDIFGVLEEVGPSYVVLRPYVAGWFHKGATVECQPYLIPLSGLMAVRGVDEAMFAEVQQMLSARQAMTIPAPGLGTPPTTGHYV